MTTESAQRLEYLLAATRYLDEGTLPECLQAEERCCGKLKLRLALFVILEWLRYVGRGGREKDSKRITGRGPAPLEAVSALLSCGGGFSQMFELQGDLLSWRASIPESERAFITTQIAEQWPIRIRV